MVKSHVYSLLFTLFDGMKLLHNLKPYRLLILLSIPVAILYSCSSNTITPFKGVKAIVNGDTLYADTAYYVRAVGGTYIHVFMGGKERLYFILKTQSVGTDSMDNKNNVAKYTSAAGKTYNAVSGVVSLTNYADTLGKSSFITGVFTIGFMSLPDSSTVVVTGGRLDTVYKQ